MSNYDIVSIILAFIAILISGYGIYLRYKSQKDSIKVGASALHGHLLGYFVVNYNRTNFLENNTFQVRQDENTVEHYIKYLNTLSDQLDELKNQSFFPKIYTIYPEIAFLSIFVRLEVKQINGNNEYGYNHDVWRHFFNGLHQVNSKLNHQRSKTEVSIFNFARDMNDYLNQN